jgi:hypothetical protein
MKIFQPIANIRYIKAILLANCAGSSVCVLAASFIFEPWDIRNETTYSLSLQDAINVAPLVTVIGFFYCLIVITPFVLVAYRWKRLFIVFSILISVLPAIAIWGVDTGIL